MTRCDPYNFRANSDEYHSIHDYKGSDDEKCDMKACGCFHTKYVIDNRGWSCDETVYTYYRCDIHKK